jgi:methyl-accepting chemotaxis protein
LSAQDDARHGETMAKSMIEAMHRIDTASNEITQIIGVIDEIAFQTNLLALNAGVEAARAGDAGRGFAVVASEVRSLAGRSAGAAKRIKELIRNSGEQVDSGVALVEDSGKVLVRIAEDIDKINALVAQIAQSQHEQAAALTEVNQAVSQMDITTQKNAAMAEESSAASKTLLGYAHELTELIDQFQITQDEPQSPLRLVHSV